MPDAMQGVLQSEQSRIKDLTAQQGTLEAQGPVLADAQTKRDQQIADSQLKRNQQIEGDYERQKGSLMPPKFAPIPPPTVKSTDPKQAWGSSAMWLAGLASLMTRTPLTTAMNSAAAVLTAYHKGDQEAANQAYQSWKVASDNAIKAFDFEQSAYKEALGDLEHRTEFKERQSDSQAAADRRQSSSESAAAERARVAQLNAVGKSLQDTFMAQVKTTEDAQRMLEERQRHADSMAENGLKLTEQHMVMSAMTEWDKAHPGADPMARAHQFSTLMYDLSPTAAKDKAKLDEHLDAVYNDPAKRQALLKSYEASIPGKQYENAKSAYGQIESLASDPDIHNNPAKQLGLVDKLIFMETGSIRPALAQYQKILGAQTGKDMFDMAMGRVAHHPIIGSDQIKNIASAATDLNHAATEAYQGYVTAPERAAVSARLGLIDDAGNLASTDGQPAPAESAASPKPGGGGAKPPAGSTPVQVKTPADASKLKPGTHYVAPDGKEYIR